MKRQIAHQNKENDILSKSVTSFVSKVERLQNQIIDRHESTNVNDKECTAKPIRPQSAYSANKSSTNLIRSQQQSEQTNVEQQMFQELQLKLSQSNKHKQSILHC